MSVSRTGDMFLAFIAAMFAAGPFHAYLCDEYKRKNVLLSSAFVMLAAMAGYAFADSYLKLMLLASVQGVCFGLATTAGITVAIDITTSTRRSAGNLVYAWSARLGMLAGACAGSCCTTFTASARLFMQPLPWEFSACISHRGYMWLSVRLSG